MTGRSLIPLQLTLVAGLVNALLNDEKMQNEPQLYSIKRYTGGSSPRFKSLYLTIKPLTPHISLPEHGTAQSCCRSWRGAQFERVWKQQHAGTARASPALGRRAGSAPRARKLLTRRVTARSFRLPAAPGGPLAAEVASSPRGAAGDAVPCFDGSGVSDCKDESTIS